MCFELNTIPQWKTYKTEIEINTEKKLQWQLQQLELFNSEEKRREKTQFSVATHRREFMFILVMWFCFDLLFELLFLLLSHRIKCAGYWVAANHLSVAGVRNCSIIATLFLCDFDLSMLRFVNVVFSSWCTTTKWKTFWIFGQVACICVVFVDEWKKCQQFVCFFFFWWLQMGCGTYRSEPQSTCKCV